jgi:thymidylate synthase (FAD)
MKIVEPSVVFEELVNGLEVLKKLERIGRTAYKSEDKITEDSAVKFIKMLMKSGHESVIEHQSVSLRIICDRGVSHELVRHRIGSFTQESTRYCSYKDELTFIQPLFFTDKDDYQGLIWRAAMKWAENAYLDLLKVGATPEQARAVLPNSIKTEIVVTFNLREWRHFLSLRCSHKAHPQMREIAFIILMLLSDKIPVIFDDLKEQYKI